MPVDFLTTEQEQNYGCYVAEPNDVQLARYFHLDERDLAFINLRRGKHNRLGIALQLTTARFLGTFLTDLTQILPGVQRFIAVQLNILRPEILSRYAERDTTHPLPTLNITITVSELRSVRRSVWPCLIYLTKSYCPSASVTECAPL